MAYLSASSFSSATNVSMICSNGGGVQVEPSVYILNHFVHTSIMASPNAPTTRKACRLSIERGLTTSRLAIFQHKVEIAV
jgi:hypothetical protein